MEAETWYLPGIVEQDTDLNQLEGCEHEEVPLLRRRNPG